MSMRYPAGFISAFFNPLKNPDAPTIGTATGGLTSISVTFTAPVDVGGGAITGYIVRSNPGGFTGTGASSPIAVSGLSSGTAYTFTVAATNAYGTGPFSAASNSASLVGIGDAFGGGYFAGQISTAGNSVADFNLVIGPVASAQNASIIFKTANTNTAGTLSVIDGPTNSSIMNNATHPAAQFCEGLTVGGFTDWYLPAKNELEVCYYNLKPTTTANNTGGTIGQNANAVPARGSNYTSGTPAQTSASLFVETTGTQAFTANFYWSSTQVSAYLNGYAFQQKFDIGTQNGELKTNYKLVRAVRRVAV